MTNKSVWHDSGVLIYNAFGFVNYSLRYLQVGPISSLLWMFLDRPGSSEQPSSTTSEPLQYRFYLAPIFWAHHVSFALYLTTDWRLLLLRLFHPRNLTELFIYQEEQCYICRFVLNLVLAQSTSSPVIYWSLYIYIDIYWWP